MKQPLMVLLHMIFMVFAVTPGLYSAPGTANKNGMDIEAAKQLLVNGTRLLKEKDILAAEKLLVSLDPANTDADVKFWLAYTQYSLRNYWMEKGNKAKAAEYNEIALKNAEIAVRLNEKSADIHALLGNLYSMKITFSDSPYAAVELGPKAMIAADKSLALDAKNPLANYFMGIQRMYTPAMYGGDIKKAIDYFNLAIRYKPDFYEAYIFLARALIRIKENQKAGDILARAIKIDTEREAAKVLLKTLQEKPVEKKE